MRQRRLWASSAKAEGHRSWRRVACDATEDVSEPGSGTDVVHPGGDDQGVDERGALPASVGTGEQPVLGSDGKAVERARWRCWSGRSDCPGEVMTARQPGSLGFERFFQLGSEGYTILLARCAPFIRRSAVGGTLDHEQPIDAPDALDRDRR